MNRFQIFRPVAVMSAVFALVACGGNDDADVPDQPSVTLGNTIAVTASGRVISFNRTAPGSLSSNVALSGLAVLEGGFAELMGSPCKTNDGYVVKFSC